MEFEIINEFIKTLIIPVMYIICYFIISKEKTIETFGSAIMNSLALYISGTISYIIIKSIFKDFWEMPTEMKVMGIFISVIFSIPFLSGLIKGIREDFRLPSLMHFEISMYMIIKYVAFLTMIGLFEFLCIFALISGEGSIAVAICGVCLLFALMLVVKRGFQELAQIEIKISDKFIASGIIITIMLLFGVIIFG